MEPAQRLAELHAIIGDLIAQQRVCLNNLLACIQNIETATRRLAELSNEARHPVETTSST